MEKLLLSPHIGLGSAETGGYIIHFQLGNGAGLHQLPFPVVIRQLVFIHCL